jgi:hypothetical protein
MVLYPTNKESVTFFKEYAGIRGLVVSSNEGNGTDVNDEIAVFLLKRSSLIFSPGYNPVERIVDAELVSKEGSIVFIDSSRMGLLGRS